MTGCYMYVVPSGNKSVNHQVNVLKKMFPYRGVWNVKGQIIGFMILLEISHSSLKSEYVVCLIGLKHSSKVQNVTVILLMYCKLYICWLNVKLSTRNVILKENKSCILARTFH